MIYVSVAEVWLKMLAMTKGVEATVAGTLLQAVQGTRAGWSKDVARLNSSKTRTIHCFLLRLLINTPHHTLNQSSVVKFHIIHSDAAEQSHCE